MMSPAPLNADGVAFSAITDVVADGCVVHVVSDIDIATAGAFENAVRRAMPATGTLLVDLAACPYIDSTALTALIRLSKSYGERLRVRVGENHHAARIFRLTGLDRIFALEP